MGWPVGRPPRGCGLLRPAVEEGCMLRCCGTFRPEHRFRCLRALRVWYALHSAAMEQPAGKGAWLPDMARLRRVCAAPVLPRYCLCAARVLSECCLYRFMLCLFCFCWRAPEHAGQEKAG